MLSAKQSGAGGWLLQQTCDFKKFRNIWPAEVNFWIAAAGTGIQMFLDLGAHWATSLHGSVKWPKIKSDLFLPTTGKVKVPIHGGYEDAASDDIADGGWDHRFPDIHANTNVRVAVKDGDRDEKYVCEDMIQAKGDKGESRPPDSPVDLISVAASERSFQWSDRFESKLLSIGLIGSST